MSKVYTKMLASATDIKDVVGMVVVGLRDWGHLTAYEKMRTVEAAHDFVAKVQREYKQRRSAGLVSSALTVSPFL